jgi:endonuclease YncB( thermonuclease family)
MTDEKIPLARAARLRRVNPTPPMPASTPATVPKTYAELLRAVKLTLLACQAEIDRAWVRCYHETGRLITEHILLFKDRADYGAKTYHRLARDTGGSERRLYQCTQFYRCFPILQTSAKLTWSHYTTLCQVDDVKQRVALTTQAARQGWVVDELEERVRAINATLALESGAAKPVVELLKPMRGIVGRYRVVAVADAFGASDDEALCVDLGFKLYLPLAPASARFRTKGEIVSVDADGGVAAVPDGKPADLFTYAVTVRRVVDGDTLEIALALPHLTLRVKLRLRGLDCPEMDTPEGKVAKREVESLMRDAKSVTIYTSKPDKYDRYLADVYLAGVVGQSSEASAKEDIFLNNHLLEHGFAERKDAWEFGDWNL